MAERWNDQAIDGLAARVADTERRVADLSAIPERVGALRDSVELLRVEARAADEREERRVSAVRSDLAERRKQDDERFEKIDDLHRRGSKVDWRTVLAVVAGVAVPIAAAIIAAGH